MAARKKRTKKNNSTEKLSLKSSKRRYLELFRFVGTIISIAVVIFGVGQYFGVKSAKKQEFKSFIEYIEQIRDGIRIENVSCQPKKLFVGETCEISIRIANETPYECDLWVGASAIGKDGKEFWNTRQDRLVTITPEGITLVKRFLTFPIGAKNGIYDLQVNLWYGRKSDPTQSERVSSAALRERIEIIQPIKKAFK